jgi:hypothetical protein
LIIFKIAIKARFDMKLRSLTLAFTTSAITVSSVFIPGNFVSAGTTKFVCGTWKGAPATIAKTPKGDVPIIRWSSKHFESAGFTPQKRCQIVSRKFQQYYNDGSLKYITTQKVKGNNIVCVAPEDQSGCTGQLFTLTPGRDPSPGEKLKQLMDIRNLASNNPVNESDGRVYINFDSYVEEASNTVNTNNSPTKTKKTATPANKPESLW